VPDTPQESAFARPETPYVADEVTTLRAFLDHYRVTVKRQVEGLTPDQLDATLPPATMTLGGIVKHLGLVEDWWLSMVLEGREAELPWVDEEALAADEDWDWHSAADDDLDTILTHFDEAVAEADRAIDRALAGDGLDTIARRPRRNGDLASLRWILVHLIEEYARHAGHADLIRESVDGATDL
jgi:uncharacterized damage-inducible protein DinB